MPRSPLSLRVPTLGRFAWLMALYGENFERLDGLVVLRELRVGCYQSRGDDGLTVVWEVLECSRHTLELRLAYDLIDPDTGMPDPSAVVRVYLDSRQAEASHCYVGRRWQDVLGIHPSPQVLMGHRLRMNTFLSKWLDYLHSQGHSPSRVMALEAEREPAIATAAVKDA